MRKWHFYMGLSLALHLILYRLLPVPEPQLLPKGPEAFLSLDLIEFPPTSLPPVLHQPVQTPKQVTPAQVVAQTKTIPTPRKTQQQIQKQPPKSIMFQDQFANQSLGFDYKLPPSQKQNRHPSDLSDTETAKRNLRSLAQQLTQPNRTTTKPSIGWGALAAETAKDGAAFYAATASGNVPAMIAVTGLSLSNGALRHTFSKLKQSYSHNHALTNEEAKLLARMTQTAPVSARDLYLTQPSGWTYKTMLKTLNKFVSMGIIHRYGQSHDAVYAAH